MTHGLCGKEGAMVFKRVLKGIGRLMLTTAVMCGVGLFLCSSEVKAANSPTISIERDSANKEFKIYLIPDPDDKDIDKDVVLYTLDARKNVELVNASSNSLCTINLIQSEIKKVNTTGTGDSDPVLIASISDRDFLIKVNESGNINNLTVGSETTVKPKVYLDSDLTELHAEPGEETAKSAPIYKATMQCDPIDTSASFKDPAKAPSFSYKNTTVGADIQYGYKEDNIEVTATPKNSFILGNYYRYYYIDGSMPTNAIDWKWSEDTGAMSIKLSGEAGKNDYKVTYLPKINELKITDPATGIVDVKVPNATSMVPSSAPNVTYEIYSWLQSDESCNKNVTAYIFNCDNTVIDNNTLASLATSNHTAGSFTVTPTLMTAGEKGSGKVKLQATLPGSDGNTFIAKEAIIPVYLSVPVSGFTLNSTTVSLMAGVEQQFDIIKAITPAGADQTISNYTFQVTESPNSTLLESISYAAGKVTLKAKSNVTSGTATVKINLMDGSNVLASQTLNVKIISFDKEKTISSINKNNKNYITYNKDKGYSLDIKQLIIDNAKDTSDNAVTITKDQITSVSVGGSFCTDGIWKPSEAATNKEVKCKVNDVQIDGIRVSAYPMPTATYSSSNRTLSVKIPTKVATSYSDDNNIRQSKGFKLILEDSSGNTLYEYTDSKYQSVLSSSSESTVTYTVPAADIEGMVTSAASNGKFSADTTSVKFKVIPMGYKQSSTSDETIKAKDEIAGKTDAVTVYKVSASGTNFTSSAAYGLDGQTVSITATPNSGYSFKQWSDGNTSNPRQVKVSASGTRAFQAVAGDRVANSTGAGGTDNSELYDDVPKTAESNSAIWLIVFMVFAVMGTTYALYLQLKAANSKHDR